MGMDICMYRLVLVSHPEHLFPAASAIVTEMGGCCVAFTKEHPINGLLFDKCRTTSMGISIKLMGMIKPMVGQAKLDGTN